MATHNYLNQTEFGYFEYLGFGDRIWPDVENQNWQTVESMIMAMNPENYVIAHGSYAYAGTATPGNLFTVTLSQNGLDAPFEGGISRLYWKISGDIVWEFTPTSTDETWYLFLEPVAGAIDPTDPASLLKLSAKSLTNPATNPYDAQDMKDKILMATVAIVSGNVTLDSSPDGQLTTNNFLSHVLDSEDPHGETLTQTNLEAKSLTIKGSQVYQEYFYDITADAGSSVEYNLDTLLVLANPDTSVVYFVTYSGKAAHTLPLWFEYHVTGNSYFTVHNPNASATDVKLSIKYLITTV